MSPIQFSHANGFPARSYKHFFLFSPPYSVSYVPALGMGSQQVRFSWRPLAKELIEDIEVRHKEPVIGIGHSLGAVVTFWAAKHRPDLFRQVILMEPPLFGWKMRAMMGGMRVLRIQDQLVPIIRNARRRRDHFNSKEEALTYFQPKFLFRNFDPQCLKDYVEHGLTPYPYAKRGYELTIPKETEARIFASSPVWIGSGKLSVPSHYLYATKGVLKGDQYDPGAQKTIFHYELFGSGRRAYVPPGTARRDRSTPVEID